MADLVSRDLGQQAALDSLARKKTLAAGIVNESPTRQLKRGSTWSSGLEAIGDLLDAVQNDDLLSVRSTLDASSAPDELLNAADEDDDNRTALHYARSAAMARCLLDRVDDPEPMLTNETFEGLRPLQLAPAEVALVLISKGARIDSSVLESMVSREEDFVAAGVGRAVAASFHLSPSETMVQVMKWAAAASREHQALRTVDVVRSDACLTLATRLQLALAGCIGELDAAEDPITGWNDQAELLRSRSGQAALRLAVACEAKVLLAQPSVQRYLRRSWRGLAVDRLMQGRQIETGRASVEGGLGTR